MERRATPTQEAYTELQAAYDYFNMALFDGQLPPCLMTMQRQRGSYGYFSGDRWANLTGTIRDEIALNPTHFITRSVEEVLSTVVHEMVHLWQHHFGTPGRGRYHNQAWADKMETLGLMPSATGMEGGARTGQHMSHYILPDRPFQVACRRLLAQGFGISWHDREKDETHGDPPTRGTPPSRTNTRAKYTCPICGLNAWAKPHVLLLCGVCHVALQEHED